MRIVQVECYSSYTYAQEPRSFTWQEEVNTIESIEKAWQEPGKRLFNVTTANGKSLNLCYNEMTDEWFAIELTH
jgi:hypothetical protein